MRKQVITRVLSEAVPADHYWLDLERLAQVEISSEDEAYPIESALTRDTGRGWRASQPGEQTIRFLFDEPQRLNRICLLFLEGERERTQEFVLRWSPCGGEVFREIVRQQYTFSPTGAIREAESYEVSLANVKALELSIIPDIGGGDVCASLARFQLA